MEFLSKVIQIYLERWPWFLELLGEQLRISLISIALAGSIGLLLGILISEHRRFAEPIIAVCNVFYTIPAIALIALLIPLVGIGEKNAILAIVLYGLMPMVRNTYTGITTIDKDLIDAAVGMGSTRRQLLLRVKLPLAMSVIIAALILRQTITAVAVIGVIVVSLAGALLVWSSGGDAVNG